MSMKYITLVSCELIPTTTQFESLKLELNIRWTSQKIEKAYRFFNFQNSSLVFKNKKMQFIIFGKILEKDITLEKHIELNIPKKLAESGNNKILKIFVNFVDYEPQEKRKLMIEKNITNIRLLEEVITQYEILSQQNRQKIEKEIFDVFFDIDFNYLPEKYHSRYFMVRFSLNKYIDSLPRLKRQEIKNKINQLNVHLVNKHRTSFDDVILSENKHKRFFEMFSKIETFTKNKLAVIIQFLYNYNLLFFFFLFLAVTSFFFSFILFFLSAFLFLFIKSVLVFDLRKNLKKNYFVKKEKSQKIYLVLFELFFNFVLSFALNYDLQYTKIIFLNFLQFFEKPFKRKLPELNNEDFSEIYKEKIEEILIDYFK